MTSAIPVERRASRTALAYIGFVAIVGVQRGAILQGRDDYSDVVRDVCREGVIVYK